MSGTVAGEEVASSEVRIHFGYNIQFAFSPRTAASGPITASSWWASPACGCGRTPAQGWGRWRTGRGRRRFLRAGWVTSAWRAPACCSAHCASDPGDTSPPPPQKKTVKIQKHKINRPLHTARLTDKRIDQVGQWNLLDNHKRHDADLHVQDLLEGFGVAVGQELNVVIDKNHGRLVWGHHHLWEKHNLKFGRSFGDLKWSHMGRLWPKWGRAGRVKLGENKQF